MAGVGNDLQRQQHKPGYQRPRQLSPGVESAEAVITGKEKSVSCWSMALKERSGGSDHRPVVSASMVNKLKKQAVTDLGYCSRFCNGFWSGKNSCFYYFRADCAPIFLLRYVSHGAGRRTGAASRRRPCPPGSGRQNRHFVVPSTYPCRLRVGPRQRPCKTRPSARIHAGCPGLPGTSPAILRPPTPAVSSQRGEDIKGRSQEL